MSFLNYEKRHSVTSILTAVVQPWRLVNFAGTHAGPNDDVQGISEEGGKAGEAISLVTGYSYPVEAAGAIAAGTWVGPAADGTGRVAAGGSFGRTLTAAAAAGDRVVVVVGTGSGAGLPPAVRGLVSDAGILGTTFCDWSTGGSIAVSGSTGATAALDSSVPLAGRPSLRITMGAPGTLQVIFTFSTPATLAQLKTLQIPTRFSRNASDDGATQVMAGPTLWLVGASGSQWRYPLDTTGWRDSTWRVWSAGPGNASQGWAFGGTPLPTTTTSMDTDTITAVRLVYVVNAIDAGESLWLGPITAGARRKGRVSVTMDGCYTSQDTNILPMMRAQGLRASLAVVNSLVGQSGSFGWSTLARHYSDGHNVMHHTFDATGGKTGGYVNAAQWPTAASITADVAAGFSDLTARGFTRGVGYGVWGYALPWAFATGKTRQDLVVNALKAGGMRAMRNGSVSGGPYTRLQSIAHVDYVDPLSVQGAIQISSGNSAQDVKDVIDRARDRGEWGVITVHRSVVSTPGSLEMTNANFDDWISYLGAQVRLGGVDCTPFDEVCSALGISAI